jgi:hypothetical protein
VRVLGVEVVEEPVGLQAMEVEPPVDLVAVVICIYPRTMVQAEEDMVLSAEVQVAPATATDTAAAEPEASPLRPRAMATALAWEAAADF